ncbi:MAG: hypothetical protein HY721_14475 [Planctomycetes bacterium]|nr:hypothetical protein [Planctomycetota bacterium]
MRTSALLAPTLAALALAGCGAPEPSLVLRTSLRYGGAGPARVVRVAAGRVRRDERSGEVLLALVEAPEGPIEPRGPGDDPLLRRAHRLGVIAQHVVRLELGLQGGVGLVILLCPVPNAGPVVLEAELPGDRGLAFGVPLAGGAVSPAHASAFLFGAAHQSVFLRLTVPEAGSGCAIARRDPRCLWIAHGLASLAATRSLGSALEDEVELAPVAYVELFEEALARGRRAICLTSWRPREPGEPLPAGEAAAEDLLCRAAAEHLCHRWQAGALRRGLARPTAALAAWLRGRTLGPPYEELTDWMRRAGDLDVGREAESVDLAEALEHHRRVWRTLGWKPAAGP